MEKAYNKITWINQPSTATPLGARLLNQQSNSIDLIDDRVVAMDTTKLDVSVANTMVKSFDMNTTTGVITVELLNGTTYTWDLNIEKIPVSLSMTPQAVLVLTTADGGTYTADLKGLIDTYNFVDGDEIAFTNTLPVGGGGRNVSASIKNGSITANKLQPNFLADVTAEANRSTAQANISANQALLSKSYAVGDSGTRTGEDEDNAKYYSEQSANYMYAAQAASGLVVPQFYIDFTDGCLKSDTEAEGIVFSVVDGNFIGRTV